MTYESQETSRQKVRAVRRQKGDAIRAQVRIQKGLLIMESRPAKGMKYLHMGPWPGFIGLCFDEKIFFAEMKRLDVKKPGGFLGSDHANATLHHLISKSGQCIYLLALGPIKGRTKEQVAGLIAHEAVHIIQQMQEDIAGGDSLGREAEAYLVQMVVQEALQMLWKSNKVRAEAPSA